MALYSKDGKVLEPQEPIVLGPNGEPISVPSSESREQVFDHDAIRRRVTAKMIKLNGWWAIAVVLGIIPLFFMGAVFFAFILLGLTISMLFRWTLRTLFKTS